MKWPIVSLDVMYGVEYGHLKANVILTILSFLGDENPTRSPVVSRDAEQRDDAPSHAWRRRATDGEVREDHQKNGVARRRSDRRTRRVRIEGAAQYYSTASQDDKVPNDRVSLILEN